MLCVMCNWTWNMGQTVLRRADSKQFGQQIWKIRRSDIIREWKLCDFRNAENDWLARSAIGFDTNQQCAIARSFYARNCDFPTSWNRSNSIFTRCMRIQMRYKHLLEGRDYSYKLRYENEMVSDENRQYPLHCAYWHELILAFRISSRKNFISILRKAIILMHSVR